MHENADFSGSCPHSALIGSTVDTCMTSVHEYFVRTWHADIISTASCIWQPSVPSCRLKSTRRGYLGRYFQKCSRILRCLARQWIHVCVSARVCGCLCLPTETGTHSANCACSSLWMLVAAQYLVRQWIQRRQLGASCAVLALRMALAMGRG